MIGLIIGGCVLCIVIGFYIYSNPDKCKSKRGQSVAFDDDALHQVSKQAMIDKIKGN
tara:strand:+ start:405 stop:575 length:171 start_codon:yes stop_codon:yes gene_type:complete